MFSILVGEILKNKYITEYKHFLFARYYSKNKIISLNHHNNQSSKYYVYPQFYGWGNQGLECQGKNSQAHVSSSKSLNQEIWSRICAINHCADKGRTNIQVRTL
jgi:hypothetical protein